MSKITRRPHAALYPVPPVLVSCQSTGPANIITLAWAGVACSDPVIVSLGIRPERYSYDIIKESGEFVVNIPSAGQLEIVDTCGVISGRDYDKFTELQITPSPTQKVQVPLIEECPVNIECRLKQIIPLGAHDLFLGEVLLVHFSEEYVVDGRFDLSLADPLAYGFSQYFRLGDLLGRHGEFVLRKR